MRRIVLVQTSRREELSDITDLVRAAVNETGVRDGLVALYAQGATAAIMIQENWDDSVTLDVVNLLSKRIPQACGSMTARTTTEMRT